MSSAKSTPSELEESAQVLKDAIDEALALDEVVQAMKRVGTTAEELTPALMRLHGEIMYATGEEFDAYHAVMARLYYIRVTIRKYVDPFWKQFLVRRKRRYDPITRLLVPFWRAVAFPVLEPDKRAFWAGRRWRRIGWRVASVVSALLGLGLAVAPPLLVAVLDWSVWWLVQHLVVLGGSAVVLLWGSVSRLAAYRRQDAARRDVLSGGSPTRLDEFERIIREDPDYRTAAAELEEVKRRLRRRLLEQLVLPTVRTLLNDILARHAPVSTDEREFQVSSAPGLGEVDDDRFRVRTVSLSRLVRLLRQLPGGSVGLSGPRGVGKTTILRALVADGDLWPGHTLRFHLSAPVRYVPFEFVSHLATEICMAVVQPVARDLVAEDEPVTREARRLRNVVAAAVHSRAALRLVALGLFAAAYALLLHNLPAVRDEIVRWAPASAVVLLLVTALRPLRRWRPGAAVADLWLPRSVLAVTASAAVLDRYGQAIWSARVQVLLWAAAGVAVGLLGLLLAVQVRRGRAEHKAEAEARLVRDKARTAAKSDLPPTLRTEAEFLLDALAHTRSRMSGTGAKLSTGAAAGIELKGELSQSHQVTLTRHDLTMPELVGRLRSLIRLATSYGRVLVAIDELDKIQDEDDARRFVNDVKAIFGVDRSYFVVAVSQDAMISFERRGLTLRTEIDSAFDEVVYASCLTVDEVRAMLAARVFGLTEPYVRLCYCLSGGLPRDAIRAMRGIINAGVAADGPVLVGDVAAVVVVDEVARWATATVSRTDLDAQDWPAEVIAALAALRARSVPPDGFPALADSLDAAAPGGRSALHRELGVVLRFHGEVHHCFAGEDVAEDAVELLAQARRDVGTNLGFAERLIEQVAARRSPPSPGTVVER